MTKVVVVVNVSVTWGRVMVVVSSVVVETVLVAGTGKGVTVTVGVKVEYFLAWKVWV